ncbi:MAG: aldo/keto reductase [Clostridia bacterium]|nr:aldo/keto reductase [Clostridia bacterium]
MEYVQLGKTGLCVSRVGFGGIPIQRIDAARTVSLFDTLIECGVNYIDTARGYTVSEEYIGQAIKGRRDKFILATKSMARTDEAMALDIETSLKNLGTDHIELYQVHNPSLEQLNTVISPNGALKALLKAKAEGKIGAIGLTAHSLEVFEAALECDWVETIMFPYSIVETHGETLIAGCREKGIGFIAMKPFAGGALDDADIALGYILNNPGVSVAIPGMYSPDEVRKNTSVCPHEFSPSETERMLKLREELGTTFCRRCGYCLPCTAGIAIPNVFTFSAYFERYGLEDWGRSRYLSMSVQADACISCGVCETRCPYNLPIRALLKEKHSAFSKDS